MSSLRSSQGLKSCSKGSGKGLDVSSLGGADAG
jgi:hypothetical protein